MEKETIGDEIMEKETNIYYLCPNQHLIKNPYDDDNSMASWPPHYITCPYKDGSIKVCGASAQKIPQEAAEEHIKHSNVKVYELNEDDDDDEDDEDEEDSHLSNMIAFSEAKKVIVDSLISAQQSLRQNVELGLTVLKETGEASEENQHIRDHAVGMISNSLRSLNCTTDEILNTHGHGSHEHDHNEEREEDKPS